jgi:hypothetical protein
LAARERQLQEEAGAARQQLREQQQSVALLQAECDEVRSQLEALAEGGSEQHRWKEEAGAAGQRLREQQQSVALLQAEYAEAKAQLEELEELRKQLAQLRAGRDGAPAQVRRLPEAAPRKLPKDAGRRHWWAKQLKALRRQQREAQQQLEELRAARLAAPAQVQEGNRGPRDRATGRGPLAAPHGPEDQGRPPERTGRESGAAAASTDRWHLVYQDKKGLRYKSTGSTRAIRRWLQKGGALKATNLRASRSLTGPFELLSSHPEFRDLVPAPAGGASWNQAPSSPSRRSPAPPSASREHEGMTVSRHRPSVVSFVKRQVPKWISWLLPVALAVASALAASHYLFHGK